MVTFHSLYKTRHRLIQRYHFRPLTTYRLATVYALRANRRHNVLKARSNGQPKQGQ